MDDLSDWLRRLGLEQYEEAFHANAIDEAILPNLTAEDLKDIGVVIVGHRRKLLDAIASLRTDGETKASPPDAVASLDGVPRSTAERRYVTVMFSDLVGSTALSGQMDPEDLREVITAYQKCVAETVRRFDGFVAKYMGDGILVYFGYPRAHEDDAERAARAGLELIAAVAALKSPVLLQTRVGIATGLVVVGDLIGSGEARERGIVGETPNFAARLQGIAAPDTVVIADDTRRLLGNLFEFHDLGPNDLKGIGSSVRAWAVLRESSVESRFEALHGTGISELVGREEESDLLLRRWLRAKAGEGQVVLISGEAGIGKSRLTAALLQRIGNEPHIRLRYFCSPQHTNTALYPVIGQFERGAGMAHDDSPKTRLDKLDAMLAKTSTSAEDAQILAEMISLPNDGRYPPLELSPQQRRQRTLEAVVLQTEALTRSNPVLMIFEDAHWIDPTTQELLVTLVERMIGWRVLLVITARPEFTPPWPNYSHIAVASLMRLDLREGAKLVDRVAGGLAVPPEVTEQILSRADGIPLFLEELTKTVLGGGFLEIRNGRYVLSKPLPELAIPTTLHASLMARLDRSELAKEIAQIGAAIGREFSYSLLRAVAAIDDATLKEALGKLEETELASCRGRPPEATYSFRHALVQDTAYASLLKTRRYAIHRQIAEALRDRFPSLADAEPEIIARHFTSANLPDPAVEWWTKAAEQALRRCAYAEAISHYRKAIASAEELGEGPQPLRRRLRLQIACGAALIAARGHGAPETTAAFTRARELAATLDDAAERFSVYYGLWAGGYIRGEQATMEEIAGIMLREIESRPDVPESVVAYRVVGTTWWSGGDFVRGRQYLEKAVAAVAPESGNALALRFGQDPSVSALVSLGLVLFGLGEIDRARALVEQAMGRAMRSGHMPTLAYGHFYACVLETLNSDPERAGRHANASAALGRTHGMPVWVAAGSFFAAWTRSCAGDEGGIVELRHALALCHERSVLNWLNLMVAVQAAAEADADNVDGGIAVIDAFVADAQPIKQRWLDAELYRQRGELLLRRTPADHGAAEAEFQRALAIARRQQTKTFELRAAVALARLWRLQGRGREAIDLLAPVYGRFTEGFASFDLKQAKSLLEELGS